MDAFIFWSGEEKWLELSQQVELSHTVWGASYPAGLYHSSGGSCEFMALLVHTHTSANAPVSGNRWDTQTLTSGIHVHEHTKHTQSQAHSAVQKWLPEQASKGLSNESYRSAEQKISLLD